MTSLYALGSNGSGQLGLGHQHDVSVPKPVILPTTSFPICPIALAAGGNHTLVLFSSGRVFWSGDATSGACGLDSPEHPVQTQAVTGDTGDNTGNRNHLFRRLNVGTASEAADSMCFVAATWEASIIVQRDGSGKASTIHTFGMGNKGELGQGPLLFRSPTPTLIKDFPPPGTEIISISACMSHVVTVLSDGSAWGWGAGRKGQLGTPADVVVHTPRRIPAPFRVVRAVCGREFTVLFAVPESGEWLYIGSDKWGIVDAAPPKIRDWVDVGASWSGIYALSRDGALRGWGRDDHGELPPQNLPPIISFAPGSEHVVALSKEGEVLTWGWGEHGNCGPGVGEDVKGRWNVIASRKHLLPEMEITGVGAGCATSWVYIAIVDEK